MVNVRNYNFTSILDITVKPEESFMNSYTDKCLKSDSAISSTAKMHIVLDYKYRKADLNRVMIKQCQHLNDTNVIVF